MCEKCLLKRKVIPLKVNFLLWEKFYFEFDQFDNFFFEFPLKKIDGGGSRKEPWILKNLKLFLVPTALTLMNKDIVIFES